MDQQSFQPNPPAPTPPQMSQETSPVRKTFTPKFIGVIVLLLVVGGVAYAGLWFWQKQSSEMMVPIFTPRNETTNWQTYRNEQYGFEFKYPGDWSVRDLTLGASHDKSIVKFFGAGPISISYDTFFSVIVYSTLLEDEISRQISLIESNPNQDLVSVSDASMFDLVGKTIVSRNKTTNESYPTHYFYKNSRTYSLDDNEQILSTFKFIEMSQFCGGIAGIQCPAGYTCKLDGNYPDTGGVCVKD